MLTLDIFLHIFLLFLLLNLNKTQLNVCLVSPYQLVNAEITKCCNYLHMFKNLSEIEARKKDFDPSSVVVPKKLFFSFRLLYLIAGNRFFQSTVFLYFTKVVAANHSSMDTVFFRSALATINCKYTMYLTDISISGALLFQRSTCDHSTVIVSGHHLQWSRVLCFFEISTCSHPFFQS